MVDYLKQEVKIQSRKLWEEAFPEDSPSFVDFYYKYRTIENQILVKEEGGQIESMAQLNPYQMKVRDQIWNIDYIVGVATREDSRHRGYMREILNRILKDMQQDDKAFCFLMPADRRIYEPFQFTYISKQPQKKIRQDSGLRRIGFQDSGVTAGELAGWMNCWLDSRYEMFCIRDEVYLNRFLKEIESELGELELLYFHDDLVGIESVWGVEKREVRQLLCQERFLEETGPEKPAVMGRIVNLRKFVTIISLADHCPKEQLRVLIEVSDPILQENHGCFWWNLDHSGSSIERAVNSNQESLEKPYKVSIEGLTEWLFGYKLLAKGPDWCQWIRGIDGIYIDEIV